MHQYLAYVNVLIENMYFGLQVSYLDCILLWFSVIYFYDVGAHPVRILLLGRKLWWKFVVALFKITMTGVHSAQPHAHEELQGAAGSGNSSTSRALRRAC